MSSGTTERLYFGAVGDVHGHMHAMVRILTGWEAKTDQRLSFVLQVGDFEPHRDEDDLATMAAPNKYRKLGEFADYYSGKVMFPWPVYFIGGNHEPYGYLDTIPGVLINGDVNWKKNIIVYVVRIELFFAGLVANRIWTSMPRLWDQWMLHIALKKSGSR